jgi:hypothetical protein
MRPRMVKKLGRHPSPVHTENVIRTGVNGPMG